MKNLYIHIGANKTGSTAIQNALEKSKGKLKSFGFLYPDAGKIWNGHFKLAWGVGAGATREKAEDNKAFWGELSKEISASVEENFIISSENFILVKSDNQVEEIKSYLGSEVNIYVLLYIRRQDLWVESLYLQAVKMGVDVGDFDSFLSKPGQELDYAKVLHPWESCLGDESVILRSYDEEKDDLLKSFFSSVGLEDFSFEGDEIHNPSLKRACAELMRRNTNRFSSREKRDGFVRFWNAEVSDKVSVNERFFSYEKRKFFLKRFQESNLEIAEKYFSRDWLFEESYMPNGISSIPSQVIFELYKAYFDSSIENHF